MMKAEEMDGDELLEVAQWASIIEPIGVEALEFFYHRDRMNASVHRSAARFSELTKALAEAYCNLPLAKEVLQSGD